MTLEKFQAIKERDQRIRELRQQGLKRGLIARMVNTSHGTVDRVLYGDSMERAPLREAK